MLAAVWSDYLCPWCYVGLDRSARLERDLGVTVTPMPFELHPDVPAGGRPLAAERGRRLYERIERECEAVGLPFRRPRRLPNSRRALATSEWVRRNHPHGHPMLHRALFDAMFVDASDIDDPDLLGSLVAACGADAAACRVAVDAGELDGPLAASRETAYDHGITGTPSWLLDGRLVVAGLQPFETFERLCARLRDRRA